MYAVGLERYGGPEVLQVVTLPDPLPTAGEIRIKVHAAGVNPVDVMVREGAMAQDYAAIEPPYVPGMEVSGIVDMIGDGVAPALGFSLGLEVVGVVKNFGRYGGYSEYVCLPALSVIPKPAGISFAEAASFPMNALTARNVLDVLDLPRGDTVLVTGAAGAVGTYTVVLAKERGLRVIAVAATQDLAFLKTAGASTVVERGDLLAERVRAIFPQGVDAVVDAAGLGDAIAPAVRDNGTVMVLRSAKADHFERAVRVIFTTVRDRATDREALEELGRKVERGQLPVRVAATFPMTEAPAAHHRLGLPGLRGRLVLMFK
jgi:NADPH:quinone reductase-like Zn-dependent oxidoreductase